MRNKYGTKLPPCKRWSSKDDEILREAYLSGASYAKMMRILWRGYGGVKDRIRYLKNTGVIKI